MKGFPLRSASTHTPKTKKAAAPGQPLRLAWEQLLGYATFLGCGASSGPRGAHEDVQTGVNLENKEMNCNTTKILGPFALDGTMDSEGSAGSKVWQHASHNRHRICGLR